MRIITRAIYAALFLLAANAASPAERLCVSPSGGTSIWSGDTLVWQSDNPDICGNWGDPMDGPATRAGSGWLVPSEGGGSCWISGQTGEPVPFYVTPDCVIWKEGRPCRIYAIDTDGDRTWLSPNTFIVTARSGNGTPRASAGSACT